MFGRRPLPPRQLHQLPASARKVFAQAVTEARRGCLFHGGCNGCVLFEAGLNKTLDGMAYCEGCRYLAAEWGLEDKSIRVA